MTYFKLNGVDYSAYVSGLTVSKSANYNSQTNARGDTLVDKLNDKRTLEVEIICLTDAIAAEILAATANLQVSVAYLDPETQSLMEGNGWILPSYKVQYYTIQNSKVLLKSFKLKFQEL